MTAEVRRERALAVVRPWTERAHNFSGWSFDDLGVVNVDAPPPWDYVAVARQHASSARRIIDLGTGGGEVYERIIAGLRGSRLYASEEWHVNAPVACQRLAPAGVKVVHASSERAPWRDEIFDLVLNRHEAIEPDEIVRILRSDGVFVTQQVAREEWRELAPFFPNRAVFLDHFRLYREAFETAACDVTMQYHAWRAAYPSIGEIAYMLLVAPWDVPGFDPERDIDRLLALEEACRTDRGIVLTQARYLMTVRKPA